MNFKACLTTQPWDWGGPVSFFFLTQSSLSHRNRFALRFLPPTSSFPPWVFHSWLSFKSHRQQEAQDLYGFQFLTKGRALRQMAPSKRQTNTNLDATVTYSLEQWSLFYKDSQVWRRVSQSGVTLCIIPAPGEMYFGFSQPYGRSSQQPKERKQKPENYALSCFLLVLFQ